VDRQSDELAAELRWFNLSTFGGAVSIPQYKDRTVDRWKIEPKFERLEIDDPPASDIAPPLWKDLTLALAVAAALWMTAAVVFFR
jgi:hypothetical protein